MTVTRPFDEHAYPMQLTPALLDVVAYARQNGGTFTRWTGGATGQTIYRRTLGQEVGDDTTTDAV